MTRGGATVGSHDPLEAMEITLELLVRPLKAAGATSWSCCIFLGFFWFSFGLAEEEDKDEDVLSLPFTPRDHTLVLFNFFS